MADTTHKQALPPGHRLGSYRVERVLGVGGFGVTYLAEHVALGHTVAVKEYLPNEFAVRDGTEVHPKSEADQDDFQWGLERFLDEARTMARFEHRNIVRVRDFFEANRTACIVMDYEDGQPLDRILERRGTLTEAQLRRVVLPIADGLREVHTAGFLHRDIKPSNVYVRRRDESPVLLDFGAARQALGRRSESLTAVVSTGYSPPEQYESEGEQGPWTDVYALSALCHRAITGDAPVEAPRRQGMLLRGRPDPLPRLAENPPDGFSMALLEAVDRGLSIIETERPQSLDEWSAGFRGGTAERAQVRIAEDVPMEHGPVPGAEAVGAVQLPATGLTRRGVIAALTTGAIIAALIATILAVVMWLPSSIIIGIAVGTIVSTSMISIMKEPDARVAGRRAYMDGDYETALYHFRPLAEEGGNFYQYRLGTMYANGQGVPQDYIQAYAWLNLAAPKSELAKHSRDRLSQRMTAAQVAEAQNLSRSLGAKI